MVAAPFDVSAFLAEPGRPAQVASISAHATPLLGSLWFAFTRGRFWFHSVAGSPLPTACGRGAPVAVIVDDFHPPAAIRQVRIRGPGRLEAPDPAMVAAIYQRYLGQDQQSWPGFFRDRLAAAQWVLWSAWPDSGLAITSPGYLAEEVRWSTRDDSPLRPD